RPMWEASHSYFRRLPGGPGWWRRDLNERFGTRKEHGHDVPDLDPDDCTWERVDAVTELLDGHFSALL
ncbi:MAG: hypothetical protein AAFQ82_17860, partial [Myxococcota bacterium]